MVWASNIVTSAVALKLAPEPYPALPLPLPTPDKPSLPITYHDITDRAEFLLIVRHMRWCIIMVFRRVPHNGHLEGFLAHFFQHLLVALV